MIYTTKPLFKDFLIKCWDHFKCDYSHIKKSRFFDLLSDHYQSRKYSGFMAQDDSEGIESKEYQNNEPLMDSLDIRDHLNKAFYASFFDLEYSKCLRGNVTSEERIVKLITLKLHPNVNQRLALINKQMLPLRIDIANKSPSGVSWGYRGSGPSQLLVGIEQSLGLDFNMHSLNNVMSILCALRDERTYEINFVDDGFVLSSSLTEICLKNAFTAKTSKIFKINHKHPDQ